MRTLKIFLLAVFIQFVVFNANLQANDSVHPYLLKCMLRLYQYLLIVKIDERVLILADGAGKEIRRYPVAVPKSKRCYSLPLVGELKGVEFNPAWRPTPQTRVAYLKKKGIALPDFVKPNDPLNAMGKVKIMINFSNSKEPIRIHGTNDPKSIGKRVSRGCIRMHNKDALGLAKFLKNSKTLVIFEK